jgi:CBS domain-containing protein
VALTALDIIEKKRPRLIDIINNEGMAGQQTFFKTDSVSSAIDVFKNSTLGLIAVVNKARKLLGLVSERDIIRAIAKKGTVVLDWPVSRVMKRQLSVATPDTYCIDTLLLMVEKRFRHMPVINHDGKFIACVDALQVAYAKLSEMTDSNRKLMRLMAESTDKVIGITTSDSVETIQAMFADKGWSSAVVTDDQKVVGFVTADELLKFSYKNRVL